VLSQLPAASQFFIGIVVGWTLSLTASPLSLSALRCATCLRAATSLELECQAICSKKSLVRQGYVDDLKALVRENRLDDADHARLRHTAVIHIVPAAALTQVEGADRDRPPRSGMVPSYSLPQL
jgi:hypothetical protein